MKSDFSGIYKVTTPGSNYLGASMIAMAPKLERRDHMVAKDKEDVVEFLVPNDTSYYHTAGGTIEDGKDGSFQVRDSVRFVDDHQQVVWLFEPLTAEMFHKMGEDGEISGWTPESKEEYATDSDVLDFYRQQWLAPMLDWWTRDPEESKDSKENQEDTKE